MNLQINGVVSIEHRQNYRALNSASFRPKRGIRMALSKTEFGTGPEAEAGGTASGSRGMFSAYLLEVVGIQQNPTELNNLGGILGHVNTVLVAGGRNVNDHVAVHLERRTLLSRHDG